VALHWGSPSTSKIRSPPFAKYDAILHASVVFPTPPLLLKKQSVFMGKSIAIEAGAEQRGYPIFLITASPNPEHFTFVTPASPSAFISRSKSYVTVLAEIAPSMPLMIRSAASFQPM